MLTFYGLGTSYGSNTYTLEFRYGEVCTDFQFPDDDPYSGGKALIYQGTAYSVSYLSSTTTAMAFGTAPPLTVTVNDVYSSTSIGLTGGAVVPYTQFSLNSISLTANLDSLGTSGTLVTGTIYGYYSMYSGSSYSGNSTNNAPFTLDRGFACPV